MGRSRGAIVTKASNILGISAYYHDTETLRLTEIDWIVFYDKPLIKFERAAVLCFDESHAQKNTRSELRVFFQA